MFRDNCVFTAACRGGATDAEVFETFLERVLVRKLRPGDIGVLDNGGTHKPEGMLDSDQGPYSYT